MWSLLAALGPLRPKSAVAGNRPDGASRGIGPGPQLTERLPSGGIIAHRQRSAQDVFLRTLTHDERPETVVPRGPRLTLGSLSLWA
jgi:hypothetical protein